MKTHYMAAAAALMASSAMVQAGGIERTTQSVGIIFEEGTYAELSFSLVNPSVSGIDPAVMATGDMTPSYFSVAGGFKMDVSDKFAVALIFDQPYGALSEYTEGLYAGTNADLTTSAITLLGSYDIGERFVVFGGATYQSMSAVAAVPLAASYTIEADSQGAVGLVAGAAFQIPEYALRVALTYRSEVSTTHNTIENSLAIPADTASTIDIVTPQSVNLEFQTGINPKTLIFGSVRWVNWDGFDITPSNYLGGSLVDYTDDRIAYNLGIGRKLSDSLSAALTLGYEKNLHGDPSVLGPTDGYFSVGGGLTYTMGNTEITAGGRYIWIGDSVGPNGTFENNDGLAFGLKISVAM